MKPGPDERDEQPDTSVVRDYLSSPEPDTADFDARAGFDADDDDPGIPPGYLERSSETRRSPVPRRIRA